MQGQLGLILGLSLAAAVATVAAMHLKSWLWGERHDDPPVVIHVVAYFAAYVVGFSALQAPDRLWPSLVVAIAAALAFAVTLNGRKPLISADYARTAALTAAVFIALWVFYQLLLLLGVDLLSDDFVRRS